MSDQKLSKSERSSLRAYVAELFGHRCLRCSQPRSHNVHEIEFKSQRPLDWWAIENMVLLCGPCHEWAHNNPKNAPSTLRILQARFFGW